MRKCGFVMPNMPKMPKILVTVLTSYLPQNPLKFKRAMQLEAIVFLCVSSNYILFVIRVVMGSNPKNTISHTTYNSS